MSELVLNDKKVLTGWAFFDWANSAYFLVISTAIFPLYFSSITDETVRFLGSELDTGTLYSYSVSFAYLCIAILSPILSGVADYGGRRMFFLKVFTILGSVACIGLFFFKSAGMIWYGTLAFVVATIGAAGGIVFYNAYLPEIATEDMYDRVSARGYAYGYIGSVLLLIFCLFMIQKPEVFGITNSTLPARISFVLVGVWWIGFAQITFRRLPKDHPLKGAHRYVKRGLHELRNVWEDIRGEVDIKRFLYAFFFYSAGVQTVIYLASLFAAEELGFEGSELILTILILQLVAILGAYLFAWVSTLLGNKASLMIQLVIWTLICLGAYFVQEKLHFYVLAGMVGMVLGGIQSLSRSTYSKLLEDRKEDLTSYFSFYDVLFKLSIIAGAFIFGFVNEVTGGMRMSVLALAVFFIVGMILLSIVRIEKTPPSEA